MWDGSPVKGVVVARRRRVVRRLVAVRKFGMGGWVVRTEARGGAVIRRHWKRARRARIRTFWGMA